MRLERLESRYAFCAGMSLDLIPLAHDIEATSLAEHLNPELTPTHSVTHQSGEAEASSAAAAGTLQGLLWNDVNANGDRDTGEPGLPGWTVFLDANRNGVLNAGETATTTTATTCTTTVRVIYL